MVRAVRIASEVAMWAFIATAPWHRLPPGIGAALAVGAFVATCTQIAFRLHDTNVAREDISIRD